MPTTTIMTTAATTAFISVAATLTATSLFKYIVMILKPVFKQAWNKITKGKENRMNHQIHRPRLVSRTPNCQLCRMDGKWIRLM